MYGERCSFSPQSFQPSQQMQVSKVRAKLVPSCLMCGDALPVQGDTSRGQQLGMARVKNRRGEPIVRATSCWTSSSGGHVEIDGGGRD